MNINELLLGAETSSWLTESISDTELKSIRKLSSISAKIELRRKSLNMNQKQFATYMGVSQGMVSKWESGEYNFSISTLQEICDKLDLDFEPTIREKMPVDNDYKIVAISSRHKPHSKVRKSMVNSTKIKDEGIA